MSIDEICSKLSGKPEKQALLRTMRLLSAVGILYEHVGEERQEVKLGLSR